MIKFDDRFLTGITLIDTQHNMLIDLANKFETSINGDDKNEIKTAIFELVDYTLYHFSAEETYVSIYNKDYLEKHKLMHKKFTEDIENFKTKLLDENINSDFIHDIWNSLVDWIENHILREDKKVLKKS